LLKHGFGAFSGRLSIPLGFLFQVTAVREFGLTEAGVLKSWNLAKTLCVSSAVAIVLAEAVRGSGNDEMDTTLFLTSGNLDPVNKVESTSFAST